MEQFLAIVGLAAFSAVKFFIAVPGTVAAGYSFWESILITTIGGLSGFFIFFYIGELKFIRYYFGKIIDFILNLFGLSLPVKEKKVKEKKKFTWKNRLIINIKGKYGIIGLALLTPCLFSIPLGSLIAARYFDDDKRTIPYMSIGILFWSLALTSFSTFIKVL